MSTYFNDLNNKELTTFLLNINSFKLKIIKTKGFDEAQVTSGGVSLQDVNLKNMEYD